MLVSLSDEGQALIPALHEMGHRITARTLEPLSEEESQTLVRLLAKLA